MIDILSITPGFQKRARKHAQAFISRRRRMTAADLSQYLNDASGAIEVPCHVPNVTFNKQSRPTSAAVKIGLPEIERRMFMYVNPHRDPDFESARVEAMICCQSVHDWVFVKYGTDPLIRASDEDLRKLCDDAPAWFSDEDPQHWIDHGVMRRAVLCSLASEELAVREEESNHQLLARLSKIGAPT